MQLRLIDWRVVATIAKIVVKAGRCSDHLEDAESRAVPATLHSTTAAAMLWTISDTAPLRSYYKMRIPLKALFLTCACGASSQPCTSTLTHQRRATHNSRNTHEIHDD